VEAAGVEPASEKARRAKPTCVSGSASFSDFLKNRQERKPPSPIDLGPQLRTEARYLACKMTLAG
jgi:hypothetical protein